MDNKKKNINIEIIIFFYPILGPNNLLKESIIKKLLSKYNDIQNILDKNESDIIIKFLYFNKIIIHKIIYDEDKVIKIESNNYNNNILFYYYLSLLINENKNVINYSYSIDYIKKINNERKNFKNKYKIIII